MNMNRIKAIAVVLPLLALLACSGTPPAALGQSAITPTPAITTRYQVIADMLSLQQRVERLESELRIARNEINALELLRAHDVQTNDTARAGQWEAWRAARIEDQKRITALEWAVAGQSWPGCIR